MPPESVVSCPQCDGVGYTPPGDRCGVCDGVGRVEQQPSNVVMENLFTWASSSYHGSTGLRIVLRPC